MNERWQAAGSGVTAMSVKTLMRRLDRVDAPPEDCPGRATRVILTRQGVPGHEIVAEGHPCPLCGTVHECPMRLVYIDGRDFFGHPDP